MSAVAIYMKTESGDSYLYCFPDLSHESIVDRLKEEMDSELGCVSEVIVSGTKTPSCIGMEEYAKRLKKKILDAVEEMWDV